MKRNRGLAAWLIALGLAYAVVALSHVSLAYLDFGDGNYLYISSRIADGLLLYRDILAPQPPLHLLLGSLVLRFARLFSAEPIIGIYFIRTTSVIIHLYMMTLLAMIALRLFRSRLIAALAALYYLLIPIGFWWNFCYESESLMLAFLLSGFYAMIVGSRKTMIAAGALHLGAVLTNMTAAPYICWVGLMLLLFDRRLLLAYALPCGLGWLAIVGLFYACGSDYLGNVFFNQVGTFPNKILYPAGLPHYITYKLIREGYKIFSYDFYYLVWGVLGLILYLRYGESFWKGDMTQPPSAVQPLPEIACADEPLPMRRRWLLGTFIFWSYMSIGFVSKGATMDYIFTIGEPLLCVMAAAATAWAYERLRGISALPARGRCLAGGLAALWLVTLGLQIFGLQFISRAILIPRSFYSGQLKTLSLLKDANVVVPHPDKPEYYLALPAFGGQRLPVRFLADLRTQSPKGQQQAELSADKVREIVDLVQANSQPGEFIVGPPHLAFVSQRPLYEEYSEHFIWRIKYWNEKKVTGQDADGVAKAESIGAALLEQRLPVTLINTQLTQVPPINAAVQERYKEIYRVQMLNTPLWVYVPKRESETKENGR
ncbi:hypothetical protein JXA32_02285 [Candidatus Sumerlaeota bacterium]|nr:hypothetical protein [Candidatus Sumerlaeota bacterium]